MIELRIPVWKRTLASYKASENPGPESAILDSYQELAISSYTFHDRGNFLYGVQLDINFPNFRGAFQLSEEFLHYNKQGELLQFMERECNRLSDEFLGMIREALDNHIEEVIAQEVKNLIMTHGKVT